MNKTVTAIFDGNVFHPDSSLDLTPNKRYLITIQGEGESPESNHSNAWDVLEALTGSIEAPPDWASEHDHYLYGTPKKHSRRSR